ncbi:phosphodiesterase [Vineibacter terrae]|uniref:phosphodiesterase n=1 Tax=Vineibacter terrae TaxID=2586908 RepID=UPI002E2F6270|nr:phosphodiesterase [Vineibacter terrae]HEX2888979.1 phosphodiesterase [Vineibacter terrae]
MIIAQITDLHVRPPGRFAYDRVNTNAMLKAAVDALMRLERRPDVVLASGDLTDCGLADEYVALRELLAPLSMPVYLVPGNHDRRENMRAVFQADGYLPADGEFLHYVIDDHPVRLIGLDTVVPGEGHGLMCLRRLNWLETQLARAPGEPTVIFMHHPPFLTGLADMDRINCRGGDSMADIVARFPNVERVLCGHHHRPIQARWAGTLASVSPSTAHQVALDLKPDNSPTMFNLEPPAYQLHVWSPYSGLVSHTAYVGDYGGPYPFVLDPDYPGHGADNAAPAEAAE